jgi:hypothetical protein
MMAKFAARDLVLQIAAPNIAGTITSVASTDIFTNTGTNGFVAGDAVVFGSLTGGAGLTVGKRYYVIATSLSATTFMVSLTVGGATFDHTSNVTAATIAKFIPVGQETELDAAGSTRGLIDASAYGDAWMDFVVGQQEGNEMNCVVALDNVSAGHVAMKTAYDAGVSKTFGMTHVAAGLDIAFPAMITKWERGGDRDSYLTGAGSLKILNPGVTDTP